MSGVTSSVPLFSIRAEYETLKSEMDAAVARVMESCRFIGGPEVEAFEREFAAAVGARFCVGVANGTDALIAALKALGVSAGDEVLVPAFTFTATAEAVVFAGARPVFVDVSAEEDYNMDPVAAEAAVTSRTAALLAVHLYGTPARMDALRAICERHGLALVEDAAQALGAAWNGAPAGSLGDAAAFSFYPTKNLGAVGDAGAVVTDDAEVARRVRLFVNHGRRSHTEHVTVGRNARLDALQAAALRVKLPHLSEWTRARRDNRRFYEETFADLDGLRVRRPPSAAAPAWHLGVVECECRDELIEHLRREGVESGVHYPHALVELPAYAFLDARVGDFPAATSAAARVLSLPVHPFLSEEERGRVADAVISFFGR